MQSIADVACFGMIQAKTALGGEWAILAWVSRVGKSLRHTWTISRPTWPGQSTFCKHMCPFDASILMHIRSSCVKALEAVVG